MTFIASPTVTLPVMQPFPAASAEDMLRSLTGTPVRFEVIARISTSVGWRVLWARWLPIDHDWIGRVGAKPGARPISRRPPPLVQSEDFADETAARHLAARLREDGDEICACVVPITAPAPPKVEQLTLAGDWPKERAANRPRASARE